MPKPISQVLQLKVGSCLTMRTKVMQSRFLELAVWCNLIRNAALRHWIVERAKNPDWEPQQRRARGNAPKVNKKGEPVLEHPSMSQDLEIAMYHAGRSVAMDVSSGIASQCWRQVTKKLQDRMPYNHEGEAKERWDAILKSEVSPPSFRGHTIPIPNATCCLAYNGVYRVGPEVGKNDPIREQLAGCKDDTAIIAFPMYAASSRGHVPKYHTRWVVFRIEVRQMSKGNRKLLRRIISGEIPMSDSTLVNKGEKGWSFQLTYKSQPKDWKLNPDNVAVLMPNPYGSKKPFTLRFSDGHKWQVGDAAPFLAELERETIRRKAIQYRYKDGRGAGHGRGRFNRKLPKRKSGRTAADRFQKKFTEALVAEVLRGLIRHDCGALEYREPSMPVRSHSKTWFAGHGASFGWDNLMTGLRNMSTGNSIAMPSKTNRLNMKEWKSMLGGKDE